MDVSGLTSVSTAAQMQAWLAANCQTPITPVMTGSDIGVILEKIVAVSGGGGGGTDLVLFAQKTNDYTLALNDTAISMSKSSANVLTVPANATVAFPVGTQILVTQTGAGQTTIAGASGVTINAADGASALRTQFSGGTLIKTAVNTWILFGDVVFVSLP